MGLKKLNVRDAKAAMPGCEFVTDIQEINKKPPFLPGVQRLLKGDKIRLNVAMEDKDGVQMFVWGQDPLLNKAYFVLATLIRGGRVLEHYHLFPSMLLRTMLKKRSAKHSTDAADPQYAHNTGIIEMLPTQRLTDYMLCYFNKEIEVINIDEDVDTWIIDFAKVREDKIDLSKEPRPIRDELWIGTKSRFYDFDVHDLVAETEHIDETLETDQTEQNG